MFVVVVVVVVITVVVDFCCKLVMAGLIVWNAPFCCIFVDVRVADLRCCRCRCRFGNRRNVADGDGGSLPACTFDLLPTKLPTSFDPVPFPIPSSSASSSGPATCEYKQSKEIGKTLRRGKHAS